MRSIQLLGALALLLSGTAQALDAGQEAELKAKISLVLGGAEVTSVSESPVPGLYEVMLGTSILYVSEDGDYLIRGDLYSRKPLKNISDARRAAARQEAFANLPPETMIEFAPTDGKVERTLYVYTDIDCGYCRKMHQEVKVLNDAGIAVRYLAFPRSGLQGESATKAVSVWCAKDRQDALTRAKAGIEVETKTCPNPVASQFKLGEQMGVRGTPAVYSDQGQQLGGYVPADEIIRMVDSGEI